MPDRDQLEIISATGGIEFYDLDPTKGVTNIGRHPDNDIVLDSPGVALFHAMLDHRQKPYQLLILSDEGQAALRGQRLLPNVASSVSNWDNLQFEGYTLILVEGEGPVVTPGRPTAPISPTVTPPLGQARPAAAPTGPRPRTTMPPSGLATTPLPARPIPVAPPTSRPEMPPGYGEPAPAAGGPPPGSTQGASISSGSLVALPPDQPDEFIVTELIDREWTVEAGQAATFQLAIVNGGDIVAMFAIGIDGLDESWVAISQPYVNLNEGERTTVTIALSPPRQPTSRAGAHHFAVVVTSPNYPSRYSQRGATLTINPYYEFSVGEIDPKQQTISWFKRSGQVSVSITNQGNSDAPFLLEGADDERGCSFEFRLDKTTTLARQVDLRLPSEERIVVPVQVTPHSRRLVGMRSRTYNFTITTSLLVEQQTRRSQLGQLKARPLIGPWILLLLALLLLILIVLIFRPTITTFTADPQMIRAGEEVTLRWSASPFANLRIGSGVGPVEGASGETIVTPKAAAGENTVVYELKAENWLSAFSSTWFTDLREVTIQVEPVMPIIRVFSVDKESIFTGEEVLLSWEVIDADELILQTNGSPETLLSTEHTNQRTTAPAGETTYTLTARNSYGQVSDSLTVRVVVPTATPIPTPQVRKFFANPSIIIAGTPVVVEWEVEGADKVSVSPIGSDLPPVQTLSQSPQENTLYTLNAANGSSAIQPIAVQVYVTPAPTSTPEPTATPQPEAPIIEFFTASPDTVVEGISEEVELTWSVVGVTTDIQISGPEFGLVTGLEPQGILPIDVKEATLLILTAFNGELSASQTVQIGADEPTPTPEPSATPLPDPSILAFRITNDPPAVRDLGGDNPHRYEVVAETDVRFEWQVDGRSTSKAVLLLGGTVLAQGVPSGEHTQNDVVRNGTYTLEAENDAGKKVSSNIVIEITEQAPPDPPFDVTGEEEPGGNTIEWEWDFDPNKSDIIGFRVYRANVPGGTFERIADEDDLPRGANTFTDDDLPTCGKAYYVVAVYLDLEDRPQESTSSPNSWFSSPC